MLSFRRDNYAIVVMVFSTKYSIVPRLFSQNNQNENEVFNSFDDIPWQDDAEDGVLVMHDPEELSPNVLKEGSSIKVNKKAKHGQRLLDGSFYDPPTDMETDHSVLYDSMTWNEDNEPKELSSSQNMVCLFSVTFHHIILKVSSFPPFALSIENRY